MCIRDRLVSLRRVFDKVCHLGVDVNTLHHGHTLSVDAAFSGFDAAVSYFLKRKDTKMNVGVKYSKPKCLGLLSLVSMFMLYKAGEKYPLEVREKIEKLLGAHMGMEPNFKMICDHKVSSIFISFIFSM